MKHRKEIKTVSGQHYTALAGHSHVLGQGRPSVGSLSSVIIHVRSRTSFNQPMRKLYEL